MKLQQIAFTALLFVLNHSAGWSQEPIPFVPTTMPVVERMLELAEVRNGDLIYDLGSGDGRVVIRAAKKYGARAVGIEMDQIAYKARQEG